MIPEIEIIKRLVLGSILGGIIGLEREVNNRPAGFRTHILVALGSTLIMLVSTNGFYIDGETVARGDPARLAAQVVSGIGFLGAGTILRNDNQVKGLTTAASLWVSAGIGLAIGTGYYLAGIVTSAITLATLRSLHSIDRVMVKKPNKELKILALDHVGIVGEIGAICGKFNIIIDNISILRNIGMENKELIKVELLIKTPVLFNESKLYNEIFKIKGISKIVYEGREVININTENEFDEEELID